MKKIRFTALLLAALLLAAIPLSAFAQPDVKSGYSDISGKWFSDAAEKFGYTEIFADGSGKFNPDSKITRIEFVRMLHRALSININYFAAPDIANSFDDIKNADVGANELIDLVTTGIIEAGGKFEPSAPLTRETMIHWIMRALNVQTGGNYAMIMIMPMPFDDDSEIAAAYNSEVYSAVVLKLVGGRGNNMLFPKDGATRAEAVTVVSRLAALLDSYKLDVVVSPFARLDSEGMLTMSLTLRNSTDKPVVISHTSGQKYDFKLFDAEGNNLYTWSADKMFIAVMNETKLAPGEEIVFSDTLDARALSDIGKATTLQAFIVGSSDDFAIDQNGYTAVIVK
jgi:hypothetical protein